MSRNLSEGNINKDAAATEFGVRQLFRRPALPAGIGVIEWIQFTSTTNLTGGGLDTLTWSFSSGNYDSTTPTFDITGGNPQICRTGIYLCFYGCSNVSAGAGVQVYTRMDLTQISGQTAFIVSPHIPGDQIHQIVGPSSTDNVNGVGELSTMITYGATAGNPFGTPTTFQVQAEEFHDGAATADSSVVFHLQFTRLGNAYS